LELVLKKSLDGVSTGLKQGYPGSLFKGLVSDVKNPSKDKHCEETNGGGNLVLVNRGTKGQLIVGGELKTPGKDCTAALDLETGEGGKQRKENERAEKQVGGWRGKLRRCRKET